MLFDSWFLLLLFAFASFRLTRLIVYDTITGFIRAPFIDEIQVVEEDGSVETYTKIKGSGLRYWIGELLSCYWCTGVWATAFLLACYYWLPELGMVLLFLFGIAGMAAIIETIVGKLTGE